MDVSYGYYAEDDDPSKGLYVVLETGPSFQAGVVFGNSKRDWKSANDRFLDKVQKGWIGDLELRTEEEAREICEDLGMDFARARSLVVENYENSAGQTPVIIEPDPSLEARIAAHGKGKPVKLQGIRT